MRDIPLALEAHINQQVTSLAECARIDLKDGGVIRVTSHDVPLTVDGDLYSARGGYTRSAIQSTDTLAVDNAVLSFVLDGVIFKKEDFENGLYDNAPITLFIVNWEKPDDGVIPLKRGTLGDVTFTGETHVEVQLRGLTQSLQKAIVEKYSPTCRVSLGGSKCGVVNVPTRIRRNRQKVKTFDWFLVPTGTTPITVVNGDFEDDGIVPVGTSGISGWTYGGNSTWGVTAGYGTLFLQSGVASGAFNVLYQDFTISDLGVDPTNVEAGDISLDLSGLIVGTNSNTDDSGVLYIEQFDASGYTLSQTFSDKITPEFDVWEGLGATVFLHPRAVVVRIGIRAILNSGNTPTVGFDAITLRWWLNASSTFNGRVFRTMRIPARGSNEAIALANPNFEQNGVVGNSTAGISGWTYGAGSYWQVNTSIGGFTPQSGSYLLGGGNDGSGVPKEYSLSQIKPLPSGLNAANVADGWYYGDFSIRVGRIDLNSTARIQLAFLNSAGAALSTFVTLMDASTPIGVWRTLRVGGLVPSGAVTVQVSIIAAGSSSANVVFDVAQAYFLVTAYENKADAERGYLAASLPTYNYNLNNYTSDGDVIVQAREARFGYTKVTAVTDSRTFEAASINMMANVFYSGKIFWLSGGNAGRTSFVRVWDNTSKIIRLYDKLTHPINIDDAFVFAPGCDKTIERCSSFFGNAHNMRAEPYLPGQQRVIEFIKGSK